MTISRSHATAVVQMAVCILCDRCAGWRIRRDKPGQTPNRHHRREPAVASVNLKAVGRRHSYEPSTVATRASKLLK